MSKFIESVESGLVESATPNVFRTRLISEGPGSSGYYSAEVLRRDLPIALPKGTKVYFDHMDEYEAMSGRARSMENLVGVFESDPYFDEAEKASYANVRFYENSPKFNSVPAFIAEALTDIGVSIEIHAGRLGEDRVVEELQFSPHNSLAVVTTPGARGKIQGLMESYRKTVDQNTDRTKMDEKDIAAIAAATSAPLLEAIKDLAESLKPVEPEVEAPSIAAVAEAVATSDLTEYGRHAVYAQVESGVAVEEAIKVQSDYEKQIREAFKKDAEDGGFRVQGSGGDFAAKAAALYGGGK